MLFLQRKNIGSYVLFTTSALQAVRIIDLVRSLSGKNWQDRDKADKVSNFFPRDS